MTIEKKAGKEVATAASAVEAVDSSRRKFAGLGASVPVLMTLASRPVMAVECYSGMMSGENLSNHDHGSCTLGSSPAEWRAPKGIVQGVSSTQAWRACGYVFGERDVGASGCKPGRGGGRRNSECYVGGSTVSDMLARCHSLPYPPGMSGAGFLSGIPTDALLLRVLEGKYGTEAMCGATGFLNASLFAPNRYVLTPEQLVCVCTRQIPVPPQYGGNVEAFLQETWS